MQLCPSALHYGVLYRLNGGFIIIYLCEFDAYRQELYYRTPNDSLAFFIGLTKGVLTRLRMPELYIRIVPGLGHIDFIHPLVGVDDFEYKAFAGRLPADAELKVVSTRDGWYVLLGVELGEGGENLFLDVFKFILALSREEYRCFMSFDHQMDCLWFGLERLRGRVANAIATWGWRAWLANEIVWIRGDRKYHLESTPWMRDATGEDEMKPEAL